MIRRAICLFVVGAVSLGLTARSSAQDKLDKEAVLKKAIEASGGAEAVKKYPAAREKTKGTIEINGLEVAFTSESVYLNPDKMKTIVNVEFMGQKIKMVQVVNGDKMRMVANGMEMPVDEANKGELKESLILHQIGQLTPLLEDKAFEVTLLPEKAKVADSEAFVVLIKAKGLKDTKIYIDTKTYLVTKMEKRGLNTEQKEGNQEYFLSDYKKVDGVMMPMKSKVLHDGAKFMESTTTELKLLDKVEKSEFDISD